METPPRRLSIVDIFKKARERDRTPEEEERWQREKDAPLVEYYKHVHPRMWETARRDDKDVKTGKILRACNEKGEVFEWMEVAK